MDDWHRYLFFALNDGKTPLFIWSLIPLQFIVQNQLLAGRIIAVLVGLVQIWVVHGILYQLRASRRAQLLGMGFTVILPFWFTYHRMALMDGMMTLMISLAFWGVLKIVELGQKQLKRWPHKMIGLSRPEVLWMTLTGLAFGAALWTKLPALFFAPIFGIVPIFLATQHSQKKSQTLWSTLFHESIPLAGALLLGLALFFSLKLNPAFGQLFGRSKDFSYSLTQVFGQGKWHETLPRWPYYLNVLTTYLTPTCLLLAMVGVFLNRTRHQSFTLLAATAAFVTPFWWLGKVVYPRYLLPAALFLTIAATLNIDQVIAQFVEKQAKIGPKILAAVVVALLLAGVIAPSVQFATYNLFDMNNIPYVPLDREQYLEEWSAGQGIVESVKYIKTQAQQHSIAVATEGSFGTLPDGILLYLHRQNVDNLYVEGIGQPVLSIPPFFVERAKKFDQVILVVNSHRMGLKLDPLQKIAEYCRPNHAPCLQLWDITTLIK